MKKLHFFLRTALVALAFLLARQLTAAPVPEIFTKTNSLPPTNAVYISPAMWHALYAQGIIIRDVRHRFFTQNLPIPPLGSTQVHQFGSTVDLSISTDNGQTFQPASGTANVTVQVTHTMDVAGKSFFDTEMLALDMTGSNSPVRIRESPTLPSRGRTTIRSDSGGYMTSSFFDIFTEISTDGGQTWLASQQATHVELRGDPTGLPPIAAPTSHLPPPNGTYISPQLFHALYAQGIVIKDVKHKFFSDHQPPPPAGGSVTHTFNSQLDMQLSTDNGVTFQPVRTPAVVTVRVSNSSSGNTGFFDTEMLQLDIQGGDLPPLVRVRESPSRPSRGATQVTLQSDGSYRINSFFDIFTELSNDGGVNWLPSTTGPVRMELQETAPPQPALSPNLPPLGGAYVSPQQWHALYASGIIISNVTHNRFTQNQPPPPPGGTQIHTFDSFVDMDILQPGQAPLHVTGAPAAVSVRVTSLSVSGDTRFFETEMLQLNIQGGSLPTGVMIRESPTKQSLGQTSIRQLGASFWIDSFFDVFTELSTDSGASWSPSTNGPGTVSLRNPPPTPIAIGCPSDIFVQASGPGGAIVNYTVTASGGCGATVTCNPPSGSLFPVGTTLVTCVAKDSCGNTITCTFNVTVQPPAVQLPEYFFKQPGLPPLEGVYISPAQFHILSSAGIQIRDVRHRFFTQNIPPPPLGGTRVHSFDSQVDFTIDNGTTSQPVSAPARVTVRVTHTHDAGGTSFFDTEMLQLDISGGSLPGGLRLRESPTLQSTGQTTVRSIPGGAMMGSFFDIFTELSMDGGQTWSPSPNPARVELRSPPMTPPVSQPTRLLPPPNGAYVSPQQWHALYAQGIIISNVSHKFFTQSVQPPTNTTAVTHSFNSTLDMDVSLNNGASFQTLRISNVTVVVRLTAVGSITSSNRLYDTEMLSMSIAGGGLPAGVMIRESPTEPSRGLTAMTGDPDFDLLRIGSFFDIFTEISLTGAGGPWSPATSGPVHVELTETSPQQTIPSPVFLPPPSGEYTNPFARPLRFANGLVISNVSHRQFNGTLLPPPTTGSVTDNFNSQIEMDMSMAGFSQHIVVPATASAKVSSTTGKDSATVRFFDTEMLQLNIAGPPLPNGMMIRESPTRASLGQTSIHSNSPSEYRIGSFFDIFPEVTLDNGINWIPVTNGPHTLRLRAPVGLPSITISCPPDIIVTATSAAGAVVTYATPVAGGGCNPPPTVTCIPASGSTFSVGTTVVTCVASDACGNKATCIFQVIVKPFIRKRLFPTDVVPPPGGQYVSPQQWHALYANGIIITNVSHRRFTGGQPPPPPGITNTHPFGSEITLLMSTDGGQTYQRMTANADVDVQMGSSSGPPGTERVFYTEMLSLNLSGGTLPPGVMIRESPTRASTGETRIQAAPGGGQMISSFFDVFTELSLNGPGGPWSPSEQAGHMELQVDPGAFPVTLTGPRFEGGQPKFSLLTKTGLRYFTRYKNDLMDPDWFILHAVSGNGQETTVSDFLQDGVSQRYYQTLVEEDIGP